MWTPVQAQEPGAEYVLQAKLKSSVRVALTTLYAGTNYRTPSERTYTLRFNEPEVPNLKMLKPLFSAKVQA